MSGIGLIGLLLVFTLLGALVWAVWRAVSPRQPPVTQPVCGQCGYAVRGLETFTCPECGCDLREVGIVSPATGKRKSPGIAGGIAAWTFLMVLISIIFSGVFRTPLMNTNSVTRSSMLTPVSGAFDHVRWTTQETHRAGVPEMRSFTYALETNSGEKAMLMIDPRDDSFRGLGPDNTQVIAGTDLTESDVLKWLGAAGIDPSDPEAILDARELATLTPQIIGGNWNAGTRMQSSGMSFNSASRPALGGGRSLVGWIVRVVWFATWVGGIILIVVRQSRARKKADQRAAGA